MDKPIGLFSKTLVIGIFILFIGTSTIPGNGVYATTSTNLNNNGSLLGFVNDTSGNPIEGALVRVHFHETYEEDYSDSTGFYHVTNISICWCMKNTTCSKEGYKTEWVLLSIAENTTYDFVLTSGNNPPDKPEIYGPLRGKPGIEYDYIFYTRDPDGNDVSYYIEWGDGTSTGWTDYFGSEILVMISHTWNEIHHYSIRCKAKDIYGAEGEWSDFVIDIPRNKAFKFKPNLFEQFFERFPLLEVLLRIMNL